MEKIQHFLQFLLPDLPCHETCCCSPQLLSLRLCAVATASGGFVNQGQFWEPGGATLTLLQKSMEEVRHWCLWWSLSGFAHHISAIHLPYANVSWYCKEMCFHGEKGSMGVTAKSCFMVMDISWHIDGYLADCWSTACDSTPHDYNPFTFLWVSGWFL